MQKQLIVYKLPEIRFVLLGKEPNSKEDRLHIPYPPMINDSGSYLSISIEEKLWAPIFNFGDIAIFSKDNSKSSFENIYLIPLKTKDAIIGRIVHSSDQSKHKHTNPQTPQFRKARRKSFMTPTPLHIPTSVVSPIADFSHDRTLVRSLNSKDKMFSILSEETLGIFPLVHIAKKTIKT
mgnify:CR=1 FL=1|jgi:hypothetical protein|tara:strand:+ start:61 stop:597 length:537 start_codon:yes stop_codon:yes gene_type:complete